LILASYTNNLFWPASNTKNACCEAGTFLGGACLASSLPEDIRRLALSVAQAGDKHDAGSTCRAVYTVKFAEAVFVLHCFQKKSKRGIATPKEDMDITNARLKIAEAFVKEYRK
jgi:hypothetical protein